MHIHVDIALTQQYRSTHGLTKYVALEEGAPPMPELDYWTDGQMTGGLRVTGGAPERYCDAFGHLLGRFNYWDDLPPCRACRRITQQLVTERRDGMTYVSDRCGQIGAVLVSRRAGVAPFAAMWSEPNGPLFNIGRRATRALAMAAVAASHDCEASE
jgi:hypothetical protein